MLYAVNVIKKDGRIIHNFITGKLHLHVLVFQRRDVTRSAFIRRE